MKTLQDKINESIALIRKAEKLALAMQPDEGFHVGFSGGKDSQAVLELVKMAGVKYRAVYNVTTNDPADNVRFIKHHYPDVEFNVPKESYFRMIQNRGLPTMRHRWCCAILKETAGVGYAVLTGVRKEESVKRAKYIEITKITNKKTDRNKKVDIDKMEVNNFQCINGKDRFMIYPILEWTESDVWQFIHERGLPVNPCYTTQKRVGCVFCPFAKKKYILSYCQSHPKLKQALINSIDKYLKSGKGKVLTKLNSAEDYFNWWIEHENMDVYIAKKRQTELKF